MTRWFVRTLTGISVSYMAGRTTCTVQVLPLEAVTSQKSHLALCVDDEVVGLQVRRILLERAGYRVLTAADGEAGLSVFEREQIEVVVLDFSMPGMDGGEVATRMRQTKPQVPILLLSAHVGLPAEITSLVDLYMTKGEGPEVLLTKVGSLLQSVKVS
ncbi:MAG: response regulator receiver protein [Acidobacteriaceae bacterium]|nr:response regulator receiver protein [Acidobacteriaceae bacterium]